MPIMKKPIEKDVQNAINAQIQRLKDAYHSNKAVNGDMIEEMKALRELFKKAEQPTIVKSIRLVYEHIEQHESLDNLAYWEEEEIELDEETPSFVYYIDLLTNPSNKYNREEIKELNIQLKELAEG